MGAAGVSMNSKSSDTSDTDRDITTAWQLVTATRCTVSIEFQGQKFLEGRVFLGVQGYHLA